jgi:hypothetical protein
VRTNAIAPAQVQAIDAALDRRDRNRLAALAAQVQKEGASATGRDRERFQALATTLRGIR